MHYYMIGKPPAAVTPVTPGVTQGLVLLVGDISVPPELQDGRIRYQIGSNEVGAYQFHRWVERPGALVCAPLLQALQISGKYRSVLVSSSSAMGDYPIRGKLYEFDEVDREATKISIALQVDLMDLKTKRVVWDDLVRRDEPVSSKNVNAVVPSLDSPERDLMSGRQKRVDFAGGFLHDCL